MKKGISETMAWEPIEIIIALAIIAIFLVVLFLYILPRMGGTGI